MSHTTTIKSTPVRDISALENCLAELRAQGCNVTLERDAVPRMYYPDQLQKHLKQSSEVCDYVVRVHDAFYDVGFIKNEDGSYSPVFDDYNYASHMVPSTRNGTKPIRDVLGAAWKGRVEHWSGNRAETEQTLHSVGKLLQGYCKHAVINQAANDGLVVESCVTDENGEMHLTLADYR
jgi:hypothetical protein